MLTLPTSALGLGVADTSISRKRCRKPFVTRELSRRVRRPRSQPNQTAFTSRTAATRQRVAPASRATVPQPLRCAAMAHTGARAVRAHRRARLRAAEEDDDGNPTDDKWNEFLQNIQDKYVGDSVALAAAATDSAWAAARAGL